MVKRLLKIGKSWFYATDIGCTDFESATASRQRQSSGYALDWWHWYEAIVRNTPHSKNLPFGLPSDEMLRG